MNILQLKKQVELNLGSVDDIVVDRSSEMFVASYLSKSPTGDIRLLESILEWNNMKKALKRVISNKGAPGVDGMKVSKLEAYFNRHRPKIIKSLLDGTYTPLPVRRKEIEKPEGGTRLLGIPAVIDRMIQQAIAQVLTLIWDHTFSENSFGFRPKRSQTDAIHKAQSYIKNGFYVSVDMDLSKFFDRVNHDRLMSRLATRVEDKRVLKLIRAFLESGVMIGGLVSETDEGAPQGGPLSPLLSNIVLDELDKELEHRKLHFVRFADDFVIYVKSDAAGKRVMKSVTKYVTTKLRLMVNEQKSAVGRPWNRKFLGIRFIKSKKNPKICLHEKSLKRFKDKIRELTSRNCGKSLQRVIDELMLYMKGWWGYYNIIESKTQLSRIDNWIRRRLRMLLWKQWKNRRTRVGELLKRGIAEYYAVRTGCARKGYWRMSNVKWVVIALPNETFHSRGLEFPWISRA
jgi:RNA-directed DNA polymerase